MLLPIEPVELIMATTMAFVGIILWRTARSKRGVLPTLTGICASYENAVLGTGRSRGFSSAKALRTALLRSPGKFPPEI